MICAGAGRWLYQVFPRLGAFIHRPLVPIKAVQILPNRPLRSRREERQGKKRQGAEFFFGSNVPIRKNILLSAPFATLAPSRFRFFLTARFPQDAKYAKVRNAKNRKQFIGLFHTLDLTPGWRALQKNFVTDIQHLSKALCHFLPDRAFSVFHLANMSLGNSGHFRKLNLRQSFPVSCAGKCFADKLPFRIFRVGFTPRYRIRCVHKSQRFQTFNGFCHVHNGAKNRISTDSIGCFFVRSCIYHLNQFDFLVYYLPYSHKGGTAFLQVTMVSVIR